MSGQLATRMAVLDAIRKLEAAGTPVRETVTHLNKNGLLPGNRKRWTTNAVIRYWNKYRVLLEEEGKTGPFDGKAAIKRSARMARIRKKYPRHQVMVHAKVEKLICNLRGFEEGNPDNSWAKVSKFLNQRKVLHEDWRASSAKWNKESVRSYAKRHGLYASDDAGSVEAPSAFLTKSMPLKKAANGAKRKVEINFSETATGRKIVGTVQMGTEETASTVSFTYEGTLDAATHEYLRSLQLLP
jgi:hypothetical protein